MQNTILTLRRRLAAPLLALALPLLAGGGPAIAADTYWDHDPAAAGDWNTLSNWTSGTPDPYTYTYVDDGTAVIGNGQTADAWNLYIGTAWIYTGFAKVTVQEGGTLNATGDVVLGADQVTAGLQVDGAAYVNGNVSLSGGQDALTYVAVNGSLAAQSFTMQDNSALQFSGNGRLEVQGSFEISDALPAIQFTLSAERDPALAFLTAQEVWFGGGALDLAGLDAMADNTTLTLIDTEAGSGGSWWNLTLLLDGAAQSLVDLGTYEDAYEFTYLGRDYTLAFGTTDVTLTSGVSQVPEPGTWAMLLGGFGVLAFFLRRRTAARAGVRL